MKRISLKTRAAAIADLQAGEQPAIVAERYGIEMGTVRVWKVRYVTDAVTLREVAERPSLVRQQQEIGVLVLDLLASKLKASAVISEQASDKAWLATQSAADLATLGEWLDTTAFAIGDRLAGRRGIESSGD